MQILSYGMISESGKNLNVLIVTETGRDWETYSSWYSIFKNLPDAKTSIVCLRNLKTPFQMFQWAKRLNVPVLHQQPLDDRFHLANMLDATRTAQKCGLLGENILVINVFTMILDVLDKNILDTINSNEVCFDDQVLFLRNPNINNILNGIFLEEKEPVTTQLCLEAKDTNKRTSIVSYKKGCGKWIDTLRGCPFSNAAGLVSTEMTVNENRIIDLWKRMCSLYSAII